MLAIEGQVDRRRVVTPQSSNRVSDDADDTRASRRALRHVTRPGWLPDGIERRTNRVVVTPILAGQTGGDHGDRCTGPHFLCGEGTAFHNSQADGGKVRLRHVVTLRPSPRA